MTEVWHIPYLLASIIKTVGVFRTLRPDHQSATWCRFPATAGLGRLLLSLAHLLVPRDLPRVAAVDLVLPMVVTSGLDTGESLGGHRSRKDMVCPPSICAKQSAGGRFCTGSFHSSPSSLLYGGAVAFAHYSPDFGNWNEQPLAILHAGNPAPIGIFPPPPARKPGEHLRLIHGEILRRDGICPPLLAWL